MLYTNMEAVLTVVHIINRIPSSYMLGLCPFEKLFGYTPDYSSLRDFGSTYFVLRSHVEHRKLSSCSTICVFLRYGEGQKGCCFDTVSQKLCVALCFVS